MRLLLDTHVLLWAIHEPHRLSARAVEAIRSSESLVSVVSHWEIAIKQSVGKLPADDRAEAWLAEQGVGLVPITLDHVRRTLTLPRHHKDPFDRMLIAQALTENLTIVTSDRAFARYGVELVDA